MALASAEDRDVVSTAFVALAHCSFTMDFTAAVKAGVVLAFASITLKEGALTSFAKASLTHPESVSFMLTTTDLWTEVWSASLSNGATFWGTISRDLAPAPCLADKLRVVARLAPTCVFWTASFAERAALEVRDDASTAYGLGAGWAGNPEARVETLPWADAAGAAGTPEVRVGTPPWADAAGAAGSPEVRVGTPPWPEVRVETPPWADAAGTFEVRVATPPWAVAAGTPEVRVGTPTGAGWAKTPEVGVEAPLGAVAATGLPNPSGTPAVPPEAL